MAVANPTININLVFPDSGGILKKECQEKSALKSNKINFGHLTFCGNMSLGPSWYIMKNLSDGKKNDVLSELQAFLLDKQLAQEKNVDLYSYVKNDVPCAEKPSRCSASS